VPEPPLTTQNTLPRAFTYALIGLIVALLATRNLPWHLDDFDQAKQAFVSFEMVQDGQWMYQHTPSGKFATKPPFAGWVSAVLYAVTGMTSWEIAWRLPSFICILAILVGLWVFGSRLMGGNLGGLLAVSAFGLTGFTPRIATLVRTDAMLSCFAFLVGLIILRKAQGSPWKRRDRWLIFLVVLAALMTKGPIIYVFILPGLLAFAVIARRKKLEVRLWPGWTCLFLPLVFLAAWAWYGVHQHPAFYDQVIGKEFLGRVSVGDEAVHNPSLPGRYTVELMGKWAPWFLLLGAVLAVRSVRQAIMREPHLLWLACWGFGGIVLMECVPSKRFDRIFPAIAPLCLLLAGAVRHLPDVLWRGITVRRLAMIVIAATALGNAGYAASKVKQGFRANQRGLVHFGEKVRYVVDKSGGRLAVVNGDGNGNEGLLLYCRVTRFTEGREAVEKWNQGSIDWLVLSKEQFDARKASLGRYEVQIDSGKVRRNDRYFFLRRRESGSGKGKVVSPAAASLFWDERENRRQTE
jgi:4-amino-4-deoxy-L-arabinose transferase-like glycosyltransferase